MGRVQPGGALTDRSAELMSRFLAADMVSRWLWGRHRPSSLGQLIALHPGTRARMARRATVAAVLALGATNLSVGAETYLLVQLAFNGGQLTFDADGPLDFGAVVLAIALGAVLNVALGLAVLRPQLDWFVLGKPADHDRRRAVQRIPRHQVYATLVAWAVGVGMYFVFADRRTWTIFLAISVAFALAAGSVACLTYLFAERAARPLTVVALRDFPAQHVVHGVHGRMLAVWVVSSGIPMFGLLFVNAGRWVGLLPNAHSSVDWTTVVLALVGLFAGARVVALVGKAIADPLNDLSRAVNNVDEGDLSVRVSVYDSSELGVLQHGFNEMVSGLEERERMRELFARHVGDTVAAQALEHGAGMRGTNADVGVLFVDIIGSTSLAAQQDPNATADLLNEFFTIVADVVDKHCGFVNKFEGDAALAVFGAPVELDDPAAAALAAARQLAERLSGELPIKWGIGVAYGATFAGNIGAERRYEYTVIGDPVNECARLSEMAKAATVPVLASGVAIKAAADEEATLWRTLGSRVLRGRGEPTYIYAPVALAGADAPSVGAGVLSAVLRPIRRSGVGGLIRLPLMMIRR